MDEARRNRRKIVKTCLVTGKFKVLHTGHLRLFHAASDVADRLVVAIDGSGVEQDELSLRRQLINNLGLVDETIVYNGDVAELIGSLKPEIVLKGHEFSRQENPEEKALAEYGGKLLFSSGTSLNDHLVLSNSSATIRHSLDFLSRRNVTSKQLTETLDQFSDLRVVVIGDLIIDRYHQCRALGMSQEYPNIVLSPIDSQTYLGGAAVVASHCKNLGANTTLISAIGSDSAGEWALAELESLGVAFLPIREDTRQTTLKERFKVGNQMMMRLNHFTNDLLAISTEQQVINHLDSLTRDSDLIIFSDFSYGLLSKDLAKTLVSQAKAAGLLCVADSQSSSQIGNLSKFAGCDLITPTEREARLETKDETSGLVVLAERLRSSIGVKNVLLKLGEAGLFIHGVDKDTLDFIENDQVPALNPSPIETSGAGDSLLAAASLSLATGSDLYTSAYLGSLAAAIHVSQDGNVPIQKSHILQHIQE
jgi:rfaE bifunctional protein kinase chain/domain